MCPSLPIYAQATWEHEAGEHPRGLQREPRHWGHGPGVSVHPQGEQAKRQTLEAENNQTIACHVTKNHYGDA